MPPARLLCETLARRGKLCPVEVLLERRHRGARACVCRERRRAPPPARGRRAGARRPSRPPRVCAGAFAARFPGPGSAANATIVNGHRERQGRFVREGAHLTVSAAEGAGEFLSPAAGRRPERVPTPAIRRRVVRGARPDAEQRERLAHGQRDALVRLEEVKQVAHRHRVRERALRFVAQHDVHRVEIRGERPRLGRVVLDDGPDGDHVLPGLGRDRVRDNVSRCRETALSPAIRGRVLVRIRLMHGGFPPARVRARGPCLRLWFSAPRHPAVPRGFTKR